MREWLRGLLHFTPCRFAFQISKSPNSALPPSMLRASSCMGVLLLALGSVSALLPGTAALRLRAAPSPSRTRVAMDETATTAKQCALISLSAEDPLRLAQVLKKAWMEGGVKRGLVGSVLVGALALSGGPEWRASSWCG